MRAYDSGIKAVETNLGLSPGTYDVVLVCADRHDRRLGLVLAVAQLVVIRFRPFCPLRYLQHLEQPVPCRSWRIHAHPTPAPVIAAIESQLSRVSKDGRSAEVAATRRSYDPEAAPPIAAF